MRMAWSMICGSSGSQAMRCVASAAALMRGVRVVLVQRIVFLMLAPRSRMCRATLMVVLGIGHLYLFMTCDLTVMMQG